MEWGKKDGTWKKAEVKEPRQVLMNPLAHGKKGVRSGERKAYMRRLKNVPATWTAKDIMAHLKEMTKASEEEDNPNEYDDVLVYHSKDRTPVDEQTLERLETEAPTLGQTAKVKVDPVLPSDQEVKAHNATHVPYQSWCAHCVAGKAKEGPHRKQPKEKDRCGLTVIQCDYIFLKDNKKKTEIPVVCACNAETGEGVALEIFAKGRRDEYAQKCISAFLREIGKSGGCILQYDPEDAIKVVCQSIAKGSTSIQLRMTPRKSKGFNGIVERYHQSVQGQLRTWKSAIYANTGVKLDPTSVLTPWMLRHASWTMRRFQKHYNGMTSFQMRTGKAYDKEVFPFGEVVLALTPIEFNEKMNLRWYKGVWLGRAHGSDEHLSGTPEGVKMVRTIKRVVDQEKWSADMISKVRGLPWDLKGVSDAAQTNDDDNRRRFVPTLGRKGCEDSHRYHHTKACEERRKEFNRGGAREELVEKEKEAMNAPQQQQGLQSRADRRKPARALERRGRPPWSSERNLRVIRARQWKWKSEWSTAST